MTNFTGQQRKVYRMIEEHYRENFKRLVSLYSGRAGGRHHAEDIIQEAYTRACKYHKTCKPDRDINGWLTLIIFNCFRDKSREDRSMGMTFTKEGDEALLYYGMTGAVQEDHLFLQDILREISEHEHSYLLELALIDGLAYGEISEIAPYSVNQVKQIVSRFREELRTKHDINV